MSSAASANLNKAIVLVILMITMTQVGYLDSMNSLTNGEETLDETDDVMETGGSSAFAYANNKLDAGDATTCAITDNGDLKCWGYDNWGMLGDGGSTNTAGTQLVAPPATAIDLGTGRTAVEVSASERHVCAILDNGSLKCWGNGAEGQLGIGTNPTVQNTPAWVDLGTGRTAISVATGRFHTCAVLDNGDVKCWGRDAEGQLGDGGINTDTNAPSSTAIDLGTGRTAVAISSSWYTTCAILDNGDLKCWGSDLRGELGDGGTNTDQSSPVSVDIGTGRTAIAVAALREYTCAILDDGSLKCWGSEGQGQLGNGGSINNGPYYSPAVVPALGTGRTAVSVTAGTEHTCVVLDNGDMKCWGWDYYGQLGDGSPTTDQTSPVLVSGSNTWDTTTTVSSGSGSNTNTLASSAEGANLIVGIPMTDITFGTNSANSSSLAMGYNHACGILDNGSVKCWGADSAGRLGQGTATQVIGDAPGEMGDALAVTNLGTGRTATSISAGLPTSSAHTCAVLDDGSVKCWGWNNNGQLGIGNTTTMGDAADKIGDNLAAVDLGTGRTAVDVSVGDRFSCALLDNGDVKCWGRNTHGQLGIGNTTTMGDAANEMGGNLSAVDLGTGRTAVAIAAGYDHVCAILDNGLVKCWGGNYHGRLGIENTTSMGDGPNEMGDNLAYASLGTGLTPVHIDAGNAHTCALFDNGSVKCWGFNQYGNLGLGNNSNQGDASNEMGDDLSFVDIGTGRTAVDLTAMTQSVCVVLDNGDVKCWGRNQHGQLGIESTATIGDGSNEMGDNLATTDLGTGVKALAIEGGFSHACAIIENGSLKCWGSNGFGMLGIGSVEQIVGDNGNEMGDNLPFVNLGTGASMPISQFTSCTSSPNLPPGLSMNNCIISGTPSSPFTNQTYNISAVRDGVTYQASIYLSASYLELTPSVEGADLSVGVPMDDITFQFNTSATIDRAMQNGVPVGILSGCAYQLISHVMDSNDHHHLAHYDGCNSDGIYYSTNSGGSWTTTLIDSGVYGTGYANAIAVDSNDNPHIAYGIDNLYYTTLSNGAWSSPIVLDQTVGRSISMVIDSSDNIHIASNRYVTGGDLNYTSYVSGTWSTETVQSAASNKYPSVTSIAVDSAGDVYIAMVQSASGSGSNINSLSVYDNSGGSWSSDLIASANTVGSYSIDLAIDSNDVKHIYYNDGGIVIKNDASGSWSSDLYTLTGNPANSFGDMVVESDGTVHIVGKYGSSFVEFHYTTNKSGSWVSREIANISSHVLHTYDALAVDSQGDMHYFFRNASTFYSGVLFHLVESGVSTVGSGSSSAPAFAYANNQVAGAMQHTCAILANGDLKCWGYDNSGQLGDGGTAANTAAPSTTAIDLGMGRTAVAVSAGDTHTCAILDNDDLKCWGAGPKGQLGMGNTVNLNAPPSTAIDLGTGRTAVAVAAGADHTCAVLDNGELKCWGGGYYGQLGDGISTDSNEPSTTAIDLGTGRTAVAVSAGEYFTCAILDNGNVTCWGRDNHGQLGDGGTNLDTNEPSTTAIDLGTGRTAVALSSGSYHTCAILDNGDLKCWGYNGFGELGDGSTSSLNAPSPTAIDLGTSRTAVAMSAGSSHTCAILDSGDIKCWGNDAVGQLGDGGGYTAISAPSTTAIDLGMGRTAVAVSAGYSHTCAALDNGDMKCWGNDGHGQLGDGGPIMSNTKQASPVLVSGSNTWDSSTGLSSGSGGGMTNVTSAISCVATPSLPAGLSIDSNTCTISGTPTAEAVNATYEINATISGITYLASIWLSSSYLELTPSAEGADLYLDVPMTDITFQYNASAASGPGGSSGSGSNSGTYNGNGTAWMVENIGGTTSSFPEKLTAVGNTLFFRANNGQVGFELWKSNGTSSGTVMVKNINSGSGSQASSNPNYLTEMGNTLYFSACLLYTSPSPRDRTRSRMPSSA